MTPRKDPPWSGSTRSRRLPSNWQALRRSILERDNWQCTIETAPGVRCSAAANEVDHIHPGDDHNPTNLAAICSSHHKQKSSQEGNRSERRLTARRPPEPHPGLRS